MSHFAVTAVGADRPGIVAAVTGALVEQGCNLEDSSMSILRGHFAMVLIVAAPDGVAAEALELTLAAPAGELGVVATVRAVADREQVGVDPGATWSVSVYGADKPGIVHQVTALLAAAGVNVLDLTTRVIGDAERPVYAMVLEVAIPATADADDLAAQLDALADELGVECSAHPADADIF